MKPSGTETTNEQKETPSENGQDVTFKARGLYASSSKEPGRFRPGPWLLLGVLLALVLVVTTVVAVLSNVTVHSTQHSDTFTGTQNLELDNRTGGEIRLSRSHDDEVVVNRTVRGGPLREPDDTIDEHGDTLRVQARCGGFLPFGVCTIDYDVTVPEDTSLDLETISGRVTVSNVHGDLDVDTTSGPVQVDDHVGDVTVRTVSGDTELQGVQGTVHAESTSGQIFVDGTFDTAEIDTVSGDVDVRTREYFTLLLVKSTSGNITTQVPAKTYDLLWETTSGSADVGVDTSSEATGRIDVSTISGSLTVTPR